VFLKLTVLTKKSIAESIGESMAYFWSLFIGIGIANTFFHEVYVLVLTILFKSIVNNTVKTYNVSDEI